MSDIQTPNGLEPNETLVGATNTVEVYQPASGGIRRNKQAFLDTLKTFFITISGAVSGHIVTVTGAGLPQDSGVAVSEIADNTADIVTNVTAIGLNTTHRSSDGKNHSDVVLNNTHRGSDGKDHSDVVLNNTHRGSNGNDHSNVVNAYKGLNRIVLTNYTGTGKPAIAANSVCEINGILYTNPSEVAITGTTANTTWYDILLTPSGSTFTASFIARGTGVWSDSKQGLYSGNNRVVAAAFRNTSDSDWINKNILIVNNRTIEIKMEIGIWDLDATISISVTHGISNFLKIRGVAITIQNDALSNLYTMPTNIGSSGSNASSLFVSGFNATTVTLDRVTSSFFDSTTFDSTSFNRGDLTIEYEV